MTERLWYKIGEAAVQIGATPKELRYWERVIPELSPRRSKGNLRYYHVDELPRLQKIRNWLAEGMTVADCRELLLTGHLARPLLFMDEEEPAPLPEPVRRMRKRAPVVVEKTDLTEAIKGLKALVKRLSQPPKLKPPAKGMLDPGDD